MTVIKTERLREAREKNNLSQRELGRLCGLGDVQIYRYESGITEPTTTSLVTLAQALHVSIDYLTGLSDHPQAQLGDETLTPDEQDVLDAYRRRDWPDLIRHMAAALDK